MYMLIFSRLGIQCNNVEENQATLQTHKFKYLFKIKPAVTGDNTGETSIVIDF